jgi:hypothetical protein
LLKINFKIKFIKGKKKEKKGKKKHITSNIRKERKVCLEISHANSYRSDWPNDCNRGIKEYPDQFRQQIRRITKGQYIKYHTIL